MSPHARRKIRNNRAQTFQFASATLYFGIPEYRERNHKNSDPFYAVQSPTWQKTTQRNICCTTGDTQRLPRRLLANFPNESVVVEMEECRCSHDAGKNIFNGVDADIRFGQTQPTVGEHQPYVHSHKRATAPKHKAHEPTDRAVALDSFPIINPDERKVLHIMKYLEQRNANQNARHDLIAVPPERNACDEQHQFHRTRPLTAAPHPKKIREKQR